MTRRGDIRSPYAGRAKEYVWSTLPPVFPRNISPTDIDLCIEYSRRFLFFEGKTWGTPMPDGQRIALQRLLLELKPHRAVLVIGQHPNLDVVDLATGLTNVQWWWNDGTNPLHVKKSRWFPNVIDNLQRRFCADAELGDLNPGEWERAIGELIGRSAVS